MMNAQKESRGLNPGSCLNQLGGGFDKTKFTTVARLLKILDRWYPWACALWGATIIAELAILALAVRP